MRANRSTWEILGSLLGLVLLIVILNSAVGYYRQGSTDFAEQARVAGRPVTLTEVLTGNTGATEEITGTTGITGTADVTGTAAITETASTTATADLTTTVTNTDVVIIDATVGVTETADVTATDTVTATNPVLASSDVTVTQDTPSTTAVTVTTTISESADVAASSEPTTTSVITATNELTPTDELTPTGQSSGAAATAVAPTSTTPADAPAELAAIFVKAGCIGCHVIPGVAGAVGMIGPNLTNIGVDGATRIEGYSSEEYIRESLLDPNAFIAPECPTGPCIPNLMVQNLGEILTPEELDAVVAYLSVQGTTAQ